MAYRTDIVAHIPLLNRSAVARQFSKFLLVGVTNTFWDYALYIVFTRGFLGFRLYFLLAQMIAFLASVLNSYLLNKRWTFHHRDTRHHIHFTKFLLVNLVGLGVYEGLLFLLVDKGGIYDLLAKAMVIVPVMFWNFAANKYWTFREPAASAGLQNG